VHIPAVDAAAKSLRVGVNMHSSDADEVILWIVNALVGHCIQGSSAATPPPYHRRQLFAVGGIRHHIQAHGVTEPRRGFEPCRNRATPVGRRTDRG
jgi:hypothetical protein